MVSVLRRTQPPYPPILRVDRPSALISRGSGASAGVAQGPRLIAPNGGRRIEDLAKTVATPDPPLGLVPGAIRGA